MWHRLDDFFLRHPVIFALVVLLLTVAAVIVLLGQSQGVGLVYKAF